MINLGGLTIPIDTAGLILAATLGLVAVATWILDRRSRMVSRGGPFVRRKLRQSTKQEEIDPKSVSQMTRYQIEHDGIRKRLLRYHAARARRAKERVVGLLMDFDLQFEETSARLHQYVRHLSSHAEQRDAVRLAKPMFGERSEHAINLALLVGDAIIISIAMLAQEQDTLTPLTAMVATMAISVAVWLSGKVLGHQLAEWSDEDGGSQYVVVALAVALMGVAAFAVGWLRVEHRILWTGLALVPALGSAGFTLLASKPRYRYEDIAKEWTRSFKRTKRLTRRLSRLEGRAGVHLIHVKNRLVRTQSLQLAEAALTNIVPADEDLHKFEKRPELLVRLLVDGRSDVVDLLDEELDQPDPRTSRDVAANFEDKRTGLPSTIDLRGEPVESEEPVVR